MGEKIKVTWNEATLESFQKLQQIFSSDFILALPDFTQEMMITTDASELGYGGHSRQNFKKDANESDEIVHEKLLVLHRLVKVSNRLIEKK